MAKTRLGDVVTIERLAASRAECRTLPYVDLDHIEKDTGAFTSDFMREPGTVLATKFKFTREHVLYGKLRPYLNKVVMPNFEGVCTTELLPLRPRASMLDRRFLSAVLRSPSFVSWASHNVSGANLPRLSSDLLGEYEFPLPPLPDQQRAGDLFDHADRLRRIRLRAVELSDSVISAEFVELFSGQTGSRVATVEECAVAKANAIRTGPFGSQLLHSEFTTAGIAVLGIDNAVENRFAWGRARFISEAKFAGLKRYQVYPEDVLITIMGTLGRCAIVPHDIGRAISTKHLCCVTVDPSICLPDYLHGAFLYHPFVQRQLRSATKGAIMDGLNMEIIKGLRIPLPPIPLQRTYARLANEQKHLLAVQMESMRLADHLLDSLLSRTFRSALAA